MRSPSAYLAGFGTSGSLLAGAAALFVVASAVIAFHGWPQIATGPATTNVAASGAPAPSRAARQLAAISAQQLATLGRGARDSAGAPGRPGTPQAGAQAPGRQPAGTSAAGPSATAAGQTASSSCTPDGCGSPASGHHPGLIAGLTGTLSQDVSKIGNSVGSAVTRTASTVAGRAGTVSPPAANTVQSAGSAAAGAVAGTTSTAAGAVAQVGAAVGGR